MRIAGSDRHDAHRLLGSGQSEIDQHRLRVGVLLVEILPELRAGRSTFLFGAQSWACAVPTHSVSKTSARVNFILPSCTGMLTPRVERSNYATAHSIHPSTNQRFRTPDGCSPTRAARLPRQPRIAVRRSRGV